MGKFIDETGNRYGSLTVLYKTKTEKGKPTKWHCLCDCGNEKVIVGNSLKSGDIKSCGCLKKEQDYINIAHITHNMSNTRLYSIWRGMQSRCNSSTGKKHEFYYDKGITVCEEWKNDFMSFFNWSMSNGYQENLSIDRIDNNKGYSPDNCRWATTVQQNNNQSNNIKILYNDKEYTLAELSQQYNIKRATLDSRLKRGWTIEKSLTMPVKYKRGRLD